AHQQPRAAALAAPDLHQAVAPQVVEGALAATAVAAVAASGTCEHRHTPKTHDKGVSRARRNRLVIRLTTRRRNREGPATPRGPRSPGREVLQAPTDPASHRARRTRTRSGAPPGCPARSPTSAACRAAAR